MTERKLTPKMRAFVDAYTGPARGNATEAARMAGYKGNDRTLAAVGAENLTKPGIATAVKMSAAKAQEAAIVTRRERQVRLSQIIRDADEETKNVIRAVEVLARMQGDMLDIDSIRSRLAELKPHMSKEAYRELLVALQAE